MTEKSESFVLFPARFQAENIKHRGKPEIRLSQCFVNLRSVVDFLSFRVRAKDQSPQS
jgi:hypothetical protein